MVHITELIFESSSRLSEIVALASAELAKEANMSESSNEKLDVLNGILIATRRALMGVEEALGVSTSILYE
jgi:hypothetical protein